MLLFRLWFRFSYVDLIRGGSVHLGAASEETRKFKKLFVTGPIAVTFALRKDMFVCLSF